MTKRYAEDIKRIVGIDPNQSQLGDPENRAAIAAGRGIGFIDKKSGAVGQVAGGSAGSTQLPASSNNPEFDRGENRAEELDADGNIIDVQNSTDPSDPTTSAVGADTGISAMQDLIDGLSPESKISTPISSTNGNTTYNNDNSLEGIEFTDCDNGKTVRVRTKQNNAGFIPPIGWTDPDTPGPAYSWTIGNEYGLYNPNDGTLLGGYEATAFLLASNANNVLGAGSMMNEAFQSVEAGSINGYGDFIATYDASILNPSIVAAYGNVFPIEASSCTPGSSSSCPIADPTGFQEWPDDDKIHLVLDGGKFVSSDRDPNQPLKYKNPAGRLTPCFGPGGARQGTIETTRQGGVMVYETSEGAPTGLVRVYDSDGRLTQAGDASNTFIDMFRTPGTESTNE